MKITKIVVQINEFGLETMFFETDVMEDPTVFAGSHGAKPGPLMLMTWVPKGSGERYAKKHFPDVPVEVSESLTCSQKV